MRAFALVGLIGVALFIATTVPVFAATTAQVWLTTLDGRAKMQRQPDLTFDNSPTPFDHQVNVDDTKLAQPFVGFGAAMTDSSAYLFNQVRAKSPARLQQVLGSLFNASGAGLNVIRIPISSSDFGLKPSFTLDDVAGDTSLSHFSMKPLEEHILPAMKSVLMFKPTIKIMLSPWSAPAWMKDSNDIGYGKLRDQYLDVYAQFWIKVLDGFNAAGISVHYLTLQNEPHFEPHGYAGMRMDAPQQADLIRRLGRLLANRTISARPKILTWDHNWDEGVDYINTVYSNTETLGYTAGSAWHCYGGDVAQQQRIWTAYPAKEIHMTECSGGDWAPNWHDNLIFNAQALYMGSVWFGSQSVQHWNLALDEHNGPTSTSGGCKTCRGVITIHSDATTVDYNVEHTGMSHFGRFLASSTLDARHCFTGASGPAPAMSSVAFFIPKSNLFGGANAVLLGLLNAGNSTVKARIVNDANEWASYTAPPGLTSFVWRARNQLEV